MLRDRGRAPRVSAAAFRVVSPPLQMEPSKPKKDVVFPDLLVLCQKPLEYEAVKTVLKHYTVKVGTKGKVRSTKLFEVAGSTSSMFAEVPVGPRKTYGALVVKGLDQGPGAAAAQTSRLIHTFYPHHVVMIGMCKGLGMTSVGDVVAGVDLVDAGDFKVISNRGEMAEPAGEGGDVWHALHQVTEKLEEACMDGVEKKEHSELFSSLLRILQGVSPRGQSSALCSMLVGPPGTKITAGKLQPQKASTDQHSMLFGSGYPRPPTPRMLEIANGGREKGMMDRAGSRWNIFPGTILSSSILDESDNAVVAGTRLPLHEHAKLPVGYDMEGYAVAQAVAGVEAPDSRPLFWGCIKGVADKTGSDRDKEEGGGGPSGSTHEDEGGEGGGEAAPAAPPKLPKQEEATRRAAGVFFSVFHDYMATHHVFGPARKRKCAQAIKYLREASRMADPDPDHRADRRSATPAGAGGAIGGRKRRRPHEEEKEKEDKDE